MIWVFWRTCVRCVFWRACVRTYTSISSDSVTVSTYLGRCASQGEGCHADATLRTVVKRTLPPQATLVSLSLSVEKDKTQWESGQEQHVHGALCALYTCCCLFSPKLPLHCIVVTVICVVRYLTVWVGKRSTCYGTTPLSLDSPLCYWGTSGG
jgi:hypothetical protein